MSDELDRANRQAEHWAARVRERRDELANAALIEAAWARRLTLTDERDPMYAGVLAGFRMAADRHLALIREAKGHVGFTGNSGGALARGAARH